MPFDQPRILAQTLTAAARRAVGAPSAAQWLGAAVLALAGMAAFGIAPGSSVDPAPTRFIERALAAPAIAAVDDGDTGYWQEERVRRGDTVGSVLSRLGIDDPETMAFLRTDPAARPLYQLRPGRGIAVETDEAGRMRALRFIARRRPAPDRGSRRANGWSRPPRRPSWRRAGRWRPAKSARRCSAPPTTPGCRTP